MPVHMPKMMARESVGLSTSNMGIPVISVTVGIAPIEAKNVRNPTRSGQTTTECLSGGRNEYPKLEIELVQSPARIDFP
jgi:hypothetical protein